MTVRAVILVLTAGCGRFGFGGVSATDAVAGDDGALDGSTARIDCDQPFTPVDHFAANVSINGQNGWFVDTSANFDEQLVAEPTAVHAGMGAWRVSNKVTSSAFSNMPRGPVLAQTVGESTVRSAGGGDSMEFVVWVRSVNTVADGSSVTLHMSPLTGDRMTYLRITNDADIASGLNLIMVDYFGGGNGRQLTVATNLPRATWIKLRMVMTAIDGTNNDVFDVWRDGALVGHYSTWEGWFDQAPPIPAVNRTMFRLNFAPSSFSGMFADANAQGVYIDDLCYRIYNASDPSVTIDFYRTGFEP